MLELYFDIDIVALLSGDNSLTISTFSYSISFSLFELDEILPLGEKGALKVSFKFVEEILFKFMVLVELSDMFLGISVKCVGKINELLVVN